MSRQKRETRESNDYYGKNVDVINVINDVHGDGNYSSPCGEFAWPNIPPLDNYYNDSYGRGHGAADSTRHAGYDPRRDPGYRGYDQQTRSSDRRSFDQHYSSVREDRFVCLFIHQSIHTQNAIHNFTRKVQVKQKIKQPCGLNGKQRPCHLRVDKTLVNTQNITLLRI